MSKQQVKRGRPFKYPWSKWLRKGATTLEKGKHFDCQVHSLVVCARREINRRRLNAIVRVRDLTILIEVA